MKFLDGLNRIIGILAGISLAVMTILVLLQILFRFCLGIPFPESQELAVYSMVYVTMLGSVMAIRNRTHVAVNFFVDLFPSHLANITRIIAYLLTVAFFCLLTWQGWLLTLRSMTQKSTVTGIPTGYIVISIPVASVVAIIFLAPHIMECIRELRKKG